MNHKV